MDRTPAAIVVPDPRYFALHKVWLADKPGRDPLKQPKDRNQAALVRQWLRADMPRYPLSPAFRTSLSVEQKKISNALDDAEQTRAGASAPQF